MHQDDPRRKSRYQRRGPKKHGYTVEDLARLTGLAITTVRAYSLREFDISDVASTATFIRRHQVKLSRKLTPDELIELLGTTERAEDWLNRWPRFDLYGCGSPDCLEMLLGGPGLCKTHSGSPITCRLNNFYYEMRVAKLWVPYHRLVMGCPKGKDIHHIDQNTFNNRLDNLEALTREEHRLKHRGGDRSEVAAGDPVSSGELN